MKKPFTLLAAALLGCSLHAVAQQNFDCDNIFFEYNPMKLSKGGPSIDKGVAFRWEEGFSLGISRSYFGAGLMVAYLWDSKGSGDTKYSQSYMTGGPFVNFGYDIRFGGNAHLVPAVGVLALVNGGWEKTGTNTSSQRIHGIKAVSLDADLGATLHLGSLAFKAGYTPGITRFSKGVNRTMWHVGIGFAI